ncbi:MAG: hypothetical protein ACYTBP_03930 [Planctomycetota bacterium]|jgi:hypothetical protein
MKMKKQFCFPAALLMIVFLLTTNTFAVSISYTETWDNNSLAEWFPNTIASNVTVFNIGGNPDGYLHSWGILAPDTFDIGATTECSVFTGDYSAVGATSISVDISFIGGTFDAAWLRFRYKDSAHNGWVYPLTNVFGNVWQTYSVNFDPNWTDAQAYGAGWLKDKDAGLTATDSNSWQETMSDVYRTEVRVSGVDLVEVGIDNFSIELAEDICGGPNDVILCAGQDIPVGTISVKNDANYLYVTYNTDGDWYLVETHLAVATDLNDIPQTKKGNPIPGRFADSNDHDPDDKVKTFTYTIDLSSLDGDVVIIAAHAVVENVLTEEPLEILEETAWGDGCEGTSFPGKNWATYFIYTVLPCDECSQEPLEPEACCLPDGSCIDIDYVSCLDLGGFPQGPGTDCSTADCPGPPNLEACCLPDGSCIDTDLGNCLGQGGIPQGPGTNCAIANCPGPPNLEACCLPDGSCIDTDLGNCLGQGGIPQGPGTNCATTDCPGPPDIGACCLPGGGCIEVDLDSCLSQGGEPQGPGTNCAIANCQGPP